MRVSKYDLKTHLFELIVYNSTFYSFIYTKSSLNLNLLSPRIKELVIFDYFYFSEEQFDRKNI